MVPVVDVPADSTFKPASMDAAWECFVGRIEASKRKPMLAGKIEGLIQSGSKELLREAARAAFQAQADACAPRCPHCGEPLQNVESVERGLDTQWGEVRFHRAYGRCPKCRTYSAPADVALGLEPNDHASPDLAEKLTWLATRMPAAQAAETFEHLTGQPVSASRVQRQAKKKGAEALAGREADREKALSPDERFEFSKKNKPPDEPEDFTLILVPDAWMIRERDDWGESEAIRAKGGEPKRWHEVKSARLFRLDHRAETSSERSMLIHSTRVATRGESEAFGQWLWTEALRMGLLRAKSVLIIADGGVWIWKLAKERFPWAKGTLDFYHASQHLWAVAHALFQGEDDAAAKAKKWVEPVIHQLRHGEHGKVLAKLEGLSRKHAQSEIAKVLSRECDYFKSHKRHIHYEAKALRGEPIGSGSVESLCRQFQVRFKRCGQFWTRDGDERLLELECRRANDRWDSLWPHLRHSEN